MSYEHWITRDIFCRQIRVHFADPAQQNMDAFLNMARESALREAVEALRKEPDRRYKSYPGEYLYLEAEDGMVEAGIDLFGDRSPAQLPVDVFIQVTTEYLEEVDTMRRELGLH